MTEHIATARAHPNIAFIKYWGNRDDALRLPANGSISMNLARLDTITTVLFSPELVEDTLFLNGKPVSGDAVERIRKHLDLVRQLAHSPLHARVISSNNFPTGTGIASSASAFAALSLAATAALGIKLSEAQLSALARRGSGSASRSIPGGFVEWFSGEDNASSCAESIAPPEHWDLVDLVAVVSSEHKKVGSTGGHGLAASSPLQTARLEDTPRRLGACRSAIIDRDFEALAQVIEQDTLIMHGVMMTSQRPLLYWLPPTLAIMHEVIRWRGDGLPVCFTIDAGPNVHVITTGNDAASVESKIRSLPGVHNVLHAPPGGPAILIDTHLSP